MKPFFYLCFAFALLQITACISIPLCERNSPSFARVPDELKEYIQHPIGSWWIYQNSLSGDIDSVYLKNSSIEVQSLEPDSCSDSMEVVVNIFTSSYNKGEIYESAYEDFYGTGYDGYGYGYLSPYDLVDTYDSILVHQRWYYSVKKYKFDRVRPEVYFFYMARNIGLIKKTGDSNQTWELIDYEISQ